MNVESKVMPAVNQEKTSFEAASLAEFEELNQLQLSLVGGGGVVVIIG